MHVAYVKQIWYGSSPWGGIQSWPTGREQIVDNADDQTILDISCNIIQDLGCGHALSLNNAGSVANVAALIGTPPIHPCSYFAVKHQEKMNLPLVR